MIVICKPNMCQQFVGPVGCFPLALVPLTDFVTSQDSGGVGSSINNKVYGHLEDRWATIKKLLVFFLLLSTPGVLLPSYLRGATIPYY